VFVKLLGEEMPTQVLVLLRSLIGLVLTGAMLRGAGVSPWGTDRRRLLLRGLLGFGGLYCFFYALARLPLAEVTVLHHTNPVLTALFAAVFLRERAGGRLAVSLALSFAGVVLVARPAALLGSASVLPAGPVAVALLGAVFSAAAYTTVRRLARTEHPLVIVLWFPLVAAPASVPAVIPVFRWPVGIEWLWIAGMGVFMQVGQVFLTRGLRALPAGRAMALAYLQIVFAALWGLVVFGERPDLWTAAGAALVVGGTLVLVTDDLFRPGRRG
jgi:drug/metabolite transporter (DMT)-like permease